MHDDCKEYFEKISEYLDGELDDTLREKIEGHLQDCPECRDCIDSLEKTIGLYQKVPPAEMSEEARNRLKTVLSSLFN